MKQLNILHIATNDYGGAGSAALRIHQAHLQHGFNSKLLVKNCKYHVGNTLSSSGSRGFFFLSKLLRHFFGLLLFKKKYLMYSVFDFNACGVTSDLDQIDFEPDYIVIHWVAGYVGLRDLEVIRDRYDVPIYWYMMDMAPVTGGCHFSYGCESYLKGCASCPADRLKLRYGIPWFYYKRKLGVLGKLRVKIIPPNKWVYDSNLKGGLAKFACNPAYIPINEKVFDLSNDGVKDNFFILFGQRNFMSGRKGGDYFLNALYKLNEIVSANPDRKIRMPIVLMPGYDGDIRSIGDFVSVISVEYASDIESLSNLYNKSDLFVCCSIEDSGPMMVTESLMSGVPVVGFKMGICPEIIIDNYNGAVVSLYDSDGLAQKIYEFMCLTQDEFSVMKFNARNSALPLVSTSSHCGQLLRIFNDCQ